MYVETEAKFEVEECEFGEIRARLKEMGANHLAGPDEERNELFDYGDHSLRRSGCTLRLRSYQQRSILTFKGPVLADPNLKKREEIETEIADGEALRAILARLGLSAYFRYDKVREIFTLEADGGAPLQICLDWTPVGCFVEIEGDPQGIERLAARFGWHEFIRRSYVEIYSERQA